MLKNHPKGQIASVQMKKNLPPTPGLPPGITAADLPDAEFMKTMQEMAEAAKNPPPQPMQQPQSPVMQNITPVKPQELKLKYVWQGVCPTCNSPVRTVMTKVDGRLFATAYCLSHEEVKQQEVYPLDSPAKQSHSPSFSGAGEKKTPSVVAQPSPLPLKVQARVNEKSQKDLTEGVK